MSQAGSLIVRSASAVVDAAESSPAVSVEGLESVQAQVHASTGGTATCQVEYTLDGSVWHKVSQSNEGKRAERALAENVDAAETSAAVDVSDLEAVTVYVTEPTPGTATLKVLESFDGVTFTQKGADLDTTSDTPVGVALTAGVKSFKLQASAYTDGEYLATAVGRVSANDAEPEQIDIATATDLPKLVDIPDAAKQVRLTASAYTDGEYQLKCAGRLRANFGG